MSFNRSGYIGRAPGDSSITIARKTYEPTGVQTDFTFSAGYDPGYCDVYLNGIKLVNGNDYTASNGSTVGLTSAAQNGDIVEVVAYKAFNLGQPLSDITGDLTISDTLTATNVSGTTSVTAGTFYGSGSQLTGVASTDYIITGTAATFNSQVKVLNLNVTGITSTTSFNVGSATTIDGGGINVTGVITATSFGPITSSTGTFSGAVNVDATTDSTSVTTGALIVDGGLGVAKNVYIGAGLSVAGTLTYEDVTSVDSVGMVTAKSGVNVSGGELNVGLGFSVGNAGIVTAAGGSFTGDVDIADKIVHTGDTNTALRFPSADTFSVETSGTESLRVDSSQRLLKGHTTASGDLQGPQTTTGRTPGIQIHGSTAPDAGASLISWSASSGSYYSPTIWLARSGSGTKGTNTIIPASNAFGSIIFSGDDGTDFVKGAMIVGDLDGTPGSDDMPGRLEFHTTADGAESPTERVRITSAGVIDVNGGDVELSGTAAGVASCTWDASANSLIFNDNSKAAFGDGSDLTIYHTGSENYIKAVNSHSTYISAEAAWLTLQSNAGIQLTDSGTNETFLKATDNGSVDIYYDNSKKFETTNDGVKITGIATCSNGLDTVGMQRESFNTVANKLSAAPNIDLDQGMIHYFTTTETTTATPNIRYNSSKSLNNMMSDGDAITVTIITKAAAAGYSANWEIDGSGVTEEWVGGSAPSTGGSDGYDIYTANILKTGSGSWIVFINLVNAT